MGKVSAGSRKIRGDVSRVSTDSEEIGGVLADSEEIGEVSEGWVLDGKHETSIASNYVQWFSRNIEFPSQIIVKWHSIIWRGVQWSNNLLALLDCFLNQAKNKQKSNQTNKFIYAQFLWKHKRRIICINPFIDHMAI